LVQSFAEDDLEALGQLRAPALHSDEGQRTVRSVPFEHLEGQAFQRAPHLLGGHDDFVIIH